MGGDQGEVSSGEATELRKKNRHLKKLAAEQSLNPDVPKKSRRLGANVTRPRAWRSSMMQPRNPIARQPTTFTTSVPCGNVPRKGRRWTRPLSANRAPDPINPPSPTINTFATYELIIPAGYSSCSVVLNEYDTTTLFLSNCAVRPRSNRRNRLCRFVTSEAPSSS